MTDRVAAEGLSRWRAIDVVTTARCRLEPLRVEHADAMVDVLADPAVYEFTGGSAPTLTQLRRRYRAQTAARSDGGKEWWLNWIVTLPDPTRAVGYTQATVTAGSGLLRADVAWVIGARFQGRGLATEAAHGMVDWLAAGGVGLFVARIHPDHRASAAVARNLGMRPTGTLEDGEVRWEANR